LVTDPPRSGMHEKVVEYINTLAPQRIVYVSCNPTTLSRDLAILEEKYTIDEVQPVDMFPHTYHIETVVKLSRK
ncbi:MAG: 23S rRNA (uracil(1939)-C(5))-methyltransferase RlmD, partial [Calditrichaceae bacterium]